MCIKKKLFKFRFFNKRKNRVMICCFVRARAPFAHFCFMSFAKNIFYVRNISSRRGVMQKKNRKKCRRQTELAKNSSKYEYSEQLLPLTVNGYFLQYGELK